MTFKNNFNDVVGHTHIPPLISERNTEASNLDDLFLFSNADTCSSHHKSYGLDDEHSPCRSLHKHPEEDSSESIPLAGNPPTDFAQQFAGWDVPSSSYEGSSLSFQTVSNLDVSNRHSQALEGPSGVAGAFAGLLLGGPVVAAMVGFGSAYAVRKQGATGDIARALGEVALSVKDKSRDWEDKYHVFRDVQQAMQTTDSKFAIRAKTMAATSWKSIVHLNEQHQLLERSVEGTGHGLEYVADKFQSLSSKKVDEEKRGDQYHRSYRPPEDIDSSDMDGTFW